MVFLVFFAIGLFVASGFAFAHKIKNINEKDETSMGIFAIFMGVIYIFVALIQCYFFYVVYRGYKYLKNVLIDPLSNLPRIE
jgi:hypothetical protein